MVKSHAAGWPEDGPTAAQLGEFFAQVRSGRVTKERFQLFLRGSLLTGPVDYGLARSILGHRFIPPEEIARKIGLIYSDEQLRYLTDTLSPGEVVECWADDGPLVAGLPQEMSLLEILEICDLSNGRDWHVKCPFSSEDKVGANWLIFRENKDRDGEYVRLELLSDEGWVVPNMAEAVWKITVSKEVNGVFVGCVDPTSEFFFIETSSTFDYRGKDDMRALILVISNEGKFEIYDGCGG